MGVYAHWQPDEAGLAVGTRLDQFGNFAGVVAEVEGPSYARGIWVAGPGRLHWAARRDEGPLCSVDVLELGWDRELGPQFWVEGRVDARGALLRDGGWFPWDE